MAEKNEFDMKALFINWFLPVSLAMGFALQVYLVESTHLTPWRGGGFGMYSTIYWLHREVWFFGLPDNVNPLDHFKTDADKVRQFPSEKNMQQLAEKVKKKYSISRVRIEVWEPKFSEEGSLHRVKLKQFETR